MARLNEFCLLKLLQVVDTRFPSVIVMLKRLKLIKDAFKPWLLVTNGLLIGRMMLENELRVVKIEFDTFSRGRFPAFKLLRQLCSSSCAERNWSIYKYIHSLKRNKMTPAHAKDLVYVHSNLQLL